jgi:hypothetical protein
MAAALIPAYPPQASAGALDTAGPWLASRHRRRDPLFEGPVAERVALSQSKSSVHATPARPRVRTRRSWPRRRSAAAIGPASCSARPTTVSSSGATTRSLFPWHASPRRAEPCQAQPCRARPGRAVPGRDDRSEQGLIPPGAGYCPRLALPYHAKPGGAVPSRAEPCRATPRQAPMPPRTRRRACPPSDRAARAQLEAPATA